MKISSILAVFVVFLLPIQVFSIGTGKSSDSLVVSQNTVAHRPKSDSIKNSLTPKDLAINAINSLFGRSDKYDNGDSIIAAFDKLPAFGIYKDNYFIVGTNVTEKPTQYTSDAKFQVSIRHRITNSKLPFRTYLFLTYTQKALWDVFKNSFPFRDLNYNPTIGLGKALTYNKRFLGTVLFQFEHESNGKGGLDSRSWNKISCTSNIIFDTNWSMSGKVWLPIVDGQNNKDLTKYTGWANIGGEYKSSDTKYCFSVIINKRSVNNVSCNLTLNFAVRLFDNENQYLFAEFYNGYGECLMDYKDYRQRLRIGFVIKPDLPALF